MRLTDDLKHWAKERPEALFLLWDGRKISYEAAEREVTALAEALRKLFSAGTVLAIRMADPAAQILYFLAAERAELVPVLLHEYLSGAEVQALLEKRPLDAALSDTALDGMTWEQEESLFLKRNSREALIKSPSEFLTARWCKTRRNFSANTEVFKENSDEVLHQRARKSEEKRFNQCFPKDERHQGFGVLTSGSSGLPKVFFRSDASWRDFFPVQNRIFHIGADSVLYLTGSMAFTGNLNMFMAFLHEGAALVGTGKVQPKRWMQDIEASRATHVYMIPSKLSALCRVKAKAAGVTHVLTGSQLMTEKLLTALESHFPQSRTILYYGASEMSYVTYIEGKEIRDFPDAVGRPFPGISISIRDGEIYVDTPYGIEGAPRPMTCRDMGRIDEAGRLHFLGRPEDQYHVKGNHVSRQKVLSHLLMLPGVEEAEVVTEKMPNGDDRLIALLVGEEREDAALVHALQEKLKPWEIPARFLWISAIPKTSTGKTDRKRLMEMMQGTRDKG